MTPAETRQWAEHHDAVYPGFLVSINDLTGLEKCWPIWETLLRDVTLADAKRASLDMAASEKQPRALRDHVRAVKIRAEVFGQRAAPLPHYVDGVRTHRCPHCRDEGYWRSHLRGRLLAMAQAQGFSAERIQKMSAMVRCGCGGGSYPRGAVQTPTGPAAQWEVY